MTVNWGDYSLVDSPLASSWNPPIGKLPRAEAELLYRQFLESMPVRSLELSNLLKANGVILDSSDSGIQNVNDWFTDNVEPSAAEPGYLPLKWYSVASDVSVFLGNVCIERCPGLHWEFLGTGSKRSMDFQKPVLGGFVKMHVPSYTTEFYRRVATYGHMVVQKNGSVPHWDPITVRGISVDPNPPTAIRERAIVRDTFVRWVKIAEANWAGNPVDRNFIFTNRALPE